MRKRKQCLAAEKAIEQGSNAIEEVIDYVAPRARQACERAEEVVVPLVNEVVERVQPALADAYVTVSDKVQHDVYPRLQDAWEQAQSDPRVAEASRRGRSAWAALRGDLSLPNPQLPEPARASRHIGRKILTALGFVALIGALVVAIRTVLGSSDDGWSPAEPLRPIDDDDADWGENPFADDSLIGEAASPGPAESAPIPPSAATAETDTADAAQSSGYGEGAYVGNEPPAGYTIKGNERSMKYHTAEAAGYDRTNADVWFNSEEAAQAAGFTRALR